MNQQSEAVRSLTDPDWREAEHARNQALRELIDAMPMAAPYRPMMAAPRDPAHARNQALLRELIDAMPTNRPITLAESLAAT